MLYKCVNPLIKECLVVIQLSLSLFDIATCCGDYLRNWHATATAWLYKIGVATKLVIAV